MRGNERLGMAYVERERAKFPIPMRGNETTTAPAITGADGLVSDPHEG